MSQPIFRRSMLPPSSGSIIREAIHQHDVGNKHLWSNYLWEANSRSDIQETLAFYGAWKFFTLFTRVHHWSLSSNRWVLSSYSRSISFRYIRSITFSSQVVTSLQILQLKPCMHFPYLQCLLRVFNVYVTFLDLIALIIFGESRSMNCKVKSLCNFLQSSFTFSVLGTGILLSTLFSNTQFLSFQLRQSFTLYVAIDKLILLYKPILRFNFR